MRSWLLTKTRVRYRSHFRGIANDLCIPNNTVAPRRRRLSHMEADSVTVGARLYKNSVLCTNNKEEVADNKKIEDRVLTASPDLQICLRRRTSAWRGGCFALCRALLSLVIPLWSIASCLLLVTKCLECRSIVSRDAGGAGE